LHREIKKDEWPPVWINIALDYIDRWMGTLAPELILCDTYKADALIRVAIATGAGSDH